MSLLKSSTTRSLADSSDVQYLNELIANSDDMKVKAFLREDGAKEAIAYCDRRGKNAVHRAAEAKCPVIVVALLDYMASEGEELVVKPTSGQDEENALHIAAKAGRFKTVKVLVKRLSEIGRIEDINLTQKHGSTALHLAAANGHLQAVKVLLGRPYDFGQIDVVDTAASNDQGETALLCAAKQGSVDVVKMLLEHLCEHKENAADQVNMNGENALHVAADRGNLDVVKALIALPECFDVNATSSFDETALQLAQAREHADVVKALMNPDEITCQSTDDAQSKDDSPSDNVMKKVSSDKVIKKKNTGSSLIAKFERLATMASDGDEVEKKELDECKATVAKKGAGNVKKLLQRWNTVNSDLGAAN